MTYLVLAVGELPRLRLDRPGAALAGAGLVVVLGVMDPGDAYRAIDLPTLTLLLGMMIIAGYLRAAGLFQWLVERVLAVARGPRALLALTAVVSGALSAVFVNDTVCLLLTPVVLLVTDLHGLPPTPFLLALCIGSNAGSVVTPIGNPQNMLIASLSGIPFREFAARLWVPGVLALGTTVVVLDRAYGARLTGRFESRALPASERAPARLARFGAIVTVAVIGALFAGVSPPVVALGGASVFLLGAGIRPSRIYATVDWTLLLLFAGLFVVTAAVEQAGWPARLTAAFGLGSADPRGAGFVVSFAGVVALLSNLVSNVPAVLVIRPLIPHLAAAGESPETLWLLLALVSTLAGNLTIVGSVANLIVVQRARQRVRIGFGEYARVGLWVGTISIALGVVWLLAGPR